MSKKRWFRFHVDHWRAGTYGLSANEIAAYITILCDLYDNEGIVALDERLLAHRCGMRPYIFRKALDGLLKRKKVTLEEGFLTSKPVEEEIAFRSQNGNSQIGKTPRTRHGLALDSPRTRHELGKKINGNKAISKKASLIENRERDKDIYSTFEGSRHPETSQAMLDAAANSPAVARLLARRRLQ